MDENQLSKIIVDSAIEAHRTLGGPGLLESIYRDAIAIEIQERGTKIELEKSIPVAYKGRAISTPLRLDLLVGGLVIVECKAAIDYNPVFESRVLI